MKYIVYCTTCLVNNKIYIGVHKTEDPDIFDGYIGNGIDKSHLKLIIKNPKTPFQNAVKKYGYKNFKRAILFIFDTEEEAYNKEAELVTLDFVKRKDTYNVALGGLKGAVYEKLYQYDLEGNFVKEWDGFQFAIEHFQCNPARFKMAINDKRSAFESYWSREKVDKLDVTEYTKSIRSEIYQCDINGNIIKVWESVNKIVEETKLSRDSMDEAIQKSKFYKQSFWIKNKNDIWRVIKSNIDNTQKKPISRYTLDGDLIVTYLNQTLCIKETKADIKELKLAIKNGIPYLNSLWTHYTEPTFKKYEPSSLDKGCKVGQYDLDGNLIKIWRTVSECAKEHPKCREVLKGFRNKTHGFVFKYIKD